MILIANGMEADFRDWMSCKFTCIFPVLSQSYSTSIGLVGYSNMSCSLENTFALYVIRDRTEIYRHIRMASLRTTLMYFLSDSLQVIFHHPTLPLLRPYLATPLVSDTGGGAEAPHNYMHSQSLAHISLQLQGRQQSRRQYQQSLQL